MYPLMAEDVQIRSGINIYLLVKQWQVGASLLCGYSRTAKFTLEFDLDKHLMKTVQRVIPNSAQVITDKR